ncbi:MAG: hypothetical protein K2I90_10170 [Odoribacter sp.]|nr:hypothetical protein [Odoribacter sp.]
MKKNRFLYALLLSLLFTACDKEEDLTPSGLGRDWFVIMDSEDPVDKAIYQFYVETGIPVFYNDTIGEETRVDNWGNAYTHYEVLQFSSSSLGGMATGVPFMSWEFCPKEDVVDGLQFLREEIVPVLPESIKIRSLLLLKSMTPYYGRGVSDEAFKGLNTVLVSHVPELKDMSDAERLNMKGAVMNALLATPVAAHTEELASFYQTTRGCYTENLYGCYGWYFYNRYNFSDPRMVGFLKDPDPSDGSNMPTETEDVGMYIKAMFIYTPKEFEALYGAFDAVMTKYRIMVSVLKEIGIKID